MRKSTVSRYFNGGYVKDETREKIQKVIEEYNYTPNAFARLNAKQSNVVGVVVPTLNSKITSRVITSIDRYLREKGYTTLIQNSDHDIDQELQNIQRLIQLNVDGILISSIAITKDHKELLNKAGIPVVVLTQDYEDGISIIYDDYKTGHTKTVLQFKLFDRGFDFYAPQSFMDESGRTKRKVKLEKLEHLRIFADTSSLEIFVNHGEEVFTTRIYNRHGRILINGECSGIMTVYPLKSFEIEGDRYEE